MKFLFTLILLFFSSFGYADSLLVSETIKVDSCNLDMEVRVYKVENQDFNFRYFVKIIKDKIEENEVERCNTMSLYSDDSIQALNIKSGTVLHFSNQTMNSFLNPEGTNTVLLKFTSKYFISPLPQQYRIQFSQGLIEVSEMN